MYNDNKDEVVYLYLDDIIPNRFQPREVFDEKALKELALSIKEHGVIQPIIVRNVNGKYEIIAGERRYKASALAGQTKIPAIIRNMDDKESSKVALLENLQRKNLSPIEEARTYQKILELDQMTQEELAKTMGKSQSSVANKLRLLALPDEIQDALLKEQISERHARALLSVPDSSKQKELLKQIIMNKMSVKLLEDEIKNMYPKDDVQNDTDSSSKEEMKFINYAEIDDEQDIVDEIPTQLNIEASIENNTIEEKLLASKDIKINKKQQAGGIDDLLNLSNNNAGPAVSGDGFKFITPAESIIKQSDTEDEKVDGDYFKDQDNIMFSSVNMETEKNTNEQYTLEIAKQKIKELSDELLKHGVNFKIEEVDFEKTYQFLFKLYK